MESIDWNQKLKEALDRTEFMAISTSRVDETWTNPVAFAYDEKMNLFFISMMESKHVQNILVHPQASAAIFSTNRFDDGEVLGLQLQGSITHLTEKSELEEASRYYFMRGASNDEFKTRTSATGNLDATWQFFKLKPTEVWCFDSRVFGEKRERVDLSKIALIFEGNA